MKPFLMDLHKEYVRTISNPFFKVGQPITDAAFERTVAGLVSKYNTSSKQKS